MTLSKIEWTDRSDWNPIRGCTRVSPGCGGPGKHGGCYAEAMAARFSKPGQWGHGVAEMRNGSPHWTGKVELQEDRITLPLRWKKPARIFVSSTSDAFHEALPDAAIDKLFAVMALCPQHTFQVLTKRPERMRKYLVGDPRADEHRYYAINDAMNEIAPAHWCKRELDDYGGLPLPNVWLGISAEDQPRADERIPDLLATPAAVRLVSFEPLLGLIDLHSKRCRETGSCPTCPKCLGGLDLAITGGESGPNARPMHSDWARSLRDQCAEASMAFFFKQWGEWAPKPDWYANHHRSLPMRAWDGSRWSDDGSIEGEWMCRVGKRAAGRLLDGVEHSAMPERRAHREAA